MHPLQQRRMMVGSACLPDVPQGFLTFLIKRVLEGIRLGQEQGLFRQIFHELTRPCDGSLVNDRIRQICADGIELGQFADLLKRSRPERHRNQSFAFAILVVERIVFVIQFVQHLIGFPGCRDHHRLRIDIGKVSLSAVGHDDLDRTDDALRHFDDAGFVFLPAFPGFKNEASRRQPVGQETLIQCLIEELRDRRAENDKVRVLDHIGMSSGRSVPLTLFHFCQIAAGDGKVPQFVERRRCREDLQHLSDQPFRTGIFCLHGIEQGVHFIQLKQHGMIHEKGILKPFTGCEGVCQSVTKFRVRCRSNCHIDSPRLFLPDAGVGQCDKVNVRSVVSFIGHMPSHKI